MNSFRRTTRRFHLAIGQLTQPFESQSKGPHHFAVTHDDAPTVRALAIEVGQYAIDAREYVYQ